MRCWRAAVASTCAPLVVVWLVCDWVVSPVALLVCDELLAGGVLCELELLDCVVGSVGVVALVDDPLVPIALVDPVVPIEPVAPVVLDELISPDGWVPLAADANSVMCLRNSSSWLRTFGSSEDDWADVFPAEGRDVLLPDVPAVSVSVLPVVPVAPEADVLSLEGPSSALRSRSSAISFAFQSAFAPCEDVALAAVDGFAE